MKPILSICIPCFRREQQVEETLKSIYEDNADVPLSEFEVVISDNSPLCEIRAVVDKFAKKGNITYHFTDCEGFMNSYFVLTYGNGEYLKLHNSQNKFYKGALRIIVENVRKYKAEKGFLYFSNGNLERGNVREFPDFNSFKKALCYWDSWSGGFGIWKEDFDNIKEIKLDPLFPHVSLFLTQHFHNRYIINDDLLMEAQRIRKRGDHNKFKAFTIHYPALIEKAEKDGLINEDVKRHIYKGLYKQYIPSLLFNKYIARIETYAIDGYVANSKVYFPKYSYLVSWLNVPFVPFRLVRKKIKIRNYKKII